ncbi:hypothetical protein GQ44DRAFT_653705 [Phaeosphaeriaceae sp. PMI808]|nr:hypothetical protein GQ44DRAFT_653705 [Phaeosphaeriaceae sp. PMI808]
MVNKYSITINNNSGSPKNYALFSGQPKITGQVNGKIWSNVFATAGTPPGGTATWVIYKTYVALNATSSGSPDSGVTTQVSGHKSVSLGAQQSDGSHIPGTSIKYIVIKTGSSDNEVLMPTFQDAELTPAGVDNAFEIQTDSTFTVEDVMQGNWLVGVGSAVNGKNGPAAMFSPIPGSSYQIKPINQFWVSSGDFVAGALVDYTVVQSLPTKIDFSASGAKSDVVINNTPNGQMVIQK